MNLPYIDGFRITKLYGTPPPPGMTYSAGKHPGVDLVGNGKQVRAVMGGVVHRSGYDPKGWGNYIAVRQPDGYFAIYCHLKKRYKSAGQTVQTGEWIGDEGSTGKVTGQHLHLELRKNYGDKYSTVNPTGYLGLVNETGVAKLAKEQVSPWAKEAWDWAKANNIMDGARPKDVVTREELAVIAQRILLIVKDMAKKTA